MKPNQDPTAKLFHCFRWTCPKCLGANVAEPDRLRGKKLRDRLVALGIVEPWMETVPEELNTPDWWFAPLRVWCSHCFAWVPTNVGTGCKHRDDPTDGTTPVPSEQT